MTIDLEPHSFVLTYADEPARRVRGHVVAPPGAPQGRERHPAVLVLHGFKGFMRWGFFPELHRRLADAGLAAVAFDFSGSGVGEDGETFEEHEAFARNTYSRELEDVHRVVEHLRSGAFPWLDSGRIGWLGHSRGGAIALLAAAELGHACAVVTWSSLDRLDRWSEETKREWRELGHILVHNARTGQDHRLDLDLLEDVERNADRLDVLAACRRLRAPVFVVHGSADESVPPSAAEAIRAALPSEESRLLVVEGAGHTFGGRHPWGGATPELERVLRESVDWLAKGCLRGGGES